MMSVGTDALTVSNVTKRFGTTLALDNVSLNIGRGESRALVGRNGAGKSTLISVVTGLLTPDSGTVRFGTGTSTTVGGVGCVYQHSMLVPEMTVAENIALGRFPTNNGFIRWGTVRKDAKRVLAEWGLEQLAPRPVSSLHPVERKIVEVSRVLSLGPSVLLLDEPTAGLDLQSSEFLFARINEARERGVSIIYISHHLHEIYEVCDSVTVLRDGKVIRTDPLADIELETIVDTMVGDAVPPQEIIAEAEGITVGEVVASVAGLHASRVHDVNFEVRRGECVGITGLDGSGHIQIGEILAGEHMPAAARITVGGKPVAGFKSVAQAQAAGIGFTPEDRRRSGFIPGMSVAENATLGFHDRLTTRLGFVSRKKRDAAYQQLARDWDIKAWGPAQLVEELSGGNQQKIVLARSVAGAPELLVLMNPTAGVDVAAKSSIYESIKNMQRVGKAVVMITADDADLAICDRILVMYRGRITAILQRGASEAEVAAAVQGSAKASASSTSA